MSVIFRAVQSGNGQSGLPDSTYTKLIMDSVLTDVGSHYSSANSRWTPPAGAVIIQGQVWVGDVSQGSLGYTDCVAKIIKNGGVGDVTWTGIGSPCGFPGWYVCPIKGVDNANGTDYYEVFIFATSPGSIARVDPNPAHTWWGGISA